MSMKITKKILAGTLALMNTFTAVSAAPVKNETPSSDSTSAKSEKPNDKSTKKELAKGAAIAAGGAAAVAAAVGGAIVLIREILKTHEVENNGSLLETSRKILELYLIPGVREYVEKYKDTELGKALNYLFVVLDGSALVNKGRVIESLQCVNSYMGIFGRKSGCDELKRFLEKSLFERVNYYNAGCLTPDNILSKYLPLSMFSGRDMYSVCADGIADFSKDKEKIMEIHPSDGKSVYNLQAIFMYDEENCCFTTAYVKHKDGKWYKHSVDGIKEKPLDDNSMLKKCSHRKVNLIYVLNQQRS